MGRWNSTLMDKVFKLLAKVIAFTVGIILALAVLFRGIVSPLWGSASDLGLLGAVGIGLFGILIILWLALKAIQNISTDLNNDTFHQLGGDVMKEDK